MYMGLAESTKTLFHLNTFCSRCETNKLHSQPVVGPAFLHHLEELLGPGLGCLGSASLPLSHFLYLSSEDSFEVRAQITPF